MWQVSWAHPRFGSLLASCSYDRKVIIWREVNANEWAQIFVFTGHLLSGSCARSYACEEHHE